MPANVISTLLPLEGEAGMGFTPQSDAMHIALRKRYSRHRSWPVRQNVPDHKSLGHFFNVASRGKDLGCSVALSASPGGRAIGNPVSFEVSLVFALRMRGAIQGSKTGPGS